MQESRYQYSYGITEFDRTKYEFRQHVTRFPLWKSSEVEKLKTLSREKFQKKQKLKTDVQKLQTSNAELQKKLEIGNPGEIYHSF